MGKWQVEHFRFEMPIANGDEMFWPKKSLWFHYRWPQDFARFAFVESCSKKHLLLYVAYRALVFAYFFGWYLSYWHNFYTKGDMGYMFIYMTTWTFTLLSVYNLVALYVAHARYRRRVQLYPHHDHRAHSGQYKHHLTTTESILWLLHCIVAVLTVQLSIQYWMLEYNPVKGPPTLTNLHVHAVSAVFFIIDVFISAFPWRALHVWMPTLYSTVYMSFTFIYHVAGGYNADDKPYIYRAIDYHQETRTRALKIALFSACVLTPTIHFAMCVLWKMRVACYNRLKQRTNKNSRHCDFRNYIPVPVKLP